jgi:hypothetical protein
MPVPGVGHLLIGIAAALLAISVLVPPLMQSLGRTRIRSRPVQGPDAVRPAGNDPQYRKLFDQFAALGFEPAGTEVQLGWFLNPWDSIWPTRWASFPFSIVFCATSS